VTDQPHPGGRRQAAFIFVLITVILDMLALGVVVPILPGLILELSGGEVVEGAKMMGWLGLIFAAAQFIGSPVLGSLSDRFGRRPVILISNLGLGLDYVLLALAPNLAVVVVARALAGFTAASVTTAFAYIADVTPPEKRPQAFGMIGAAFGLGFVVGPAMGGLLADFGPRVPFWVAACLSLINFCYGLLVLPESLSPEKRSPFRWRLANPMGSIRLLRSDPQVARLAGANFLSNIAHESLPAIFVLYAGTRYGWGPKEVGLSLAAIGVCSALVQGALTGRISAALGPRRTMLLGLAAGVAGFFIYGVASEPWMIFVGIPFNALWGLAGPASQTLMTVRMAPEDQGKLQGALSSTRGIAGMIGPVLFARTFAAFVTPVLGFALPGAAFLLASLMLVFAITLARSISLQSDLPAQKG